MHGEMGRAQWGRRELLQCDQEKLVRAPTVVNHCSTLQDGQATSTVTLRGCAVADEDRCNRVRGFSDNASHRGLHARGMWMASVTKSRRGGRSIYNEDAEER